MLKRGAQHITLFSTTYYNGCLGTPTTLTNRLLSVIDFSESPFCGDFATNAVYLDLHTPTTPRSSAQFLANLRPDRLEALYKNQPRFLERVKQLDQRLLELAHMRYEAANSFINKSNNNRLRLAGSRPTHHKRSNY